MFGILQSGHVSSYERDEQYHCFYQVLKQHEHTPGPGAYSPDKHLSQKQRINATMQFFGSTQHRSYQQDLSKMHAAPMIYKTPGPGMYSKPAKSPKEFGTRSAVNPKSGFNGSSERFRGSETDAPGPGKRLLLRSLA